MGLEGGFPGVEVGIGLGMKATECAEVGKERDM